MFDAIFEGGHGITTRVRVFAIFIAALGAGLLTPPAPTTEGLPHWETFGHASDGVRRPTPSAETFGHASDGVRRPAPSAVTTTSIQLRDVTAQTGIKFQHTDGSSGRRYIVETVASGVATFDYDGDGLIDILFLNGSSLPGAKADPNAGSALYRNRGGLEFEDVTQSAGLGNSGYALGVAIADADNDGDPDIYLSRFGSNAYYQNNGDGTFTNSTEATGTEGGGEQKVGAGVCFLDADNDGLLDLFVANYLQFSYDQHATATRRGVPVYVAPERYSALPSIFFRNNGDGTFSDLSRQSGVSQHLGRGMGVVAVDYDNDGDTDVFVANDGAANFLWRNDGQGRFQEVGLVSGVAYDYQGQAQGSMGVDCGDADNDGRLDFYKTAFHLQLATLYRSAGEGQFEDATLTSGAGQGTVSNVTWGCGWVDLENDGDRDLFVACGHLQDNVELFDGTTSYRARNVVLQNLLRETGRLRFLNVSAQCGEGLRSQHSGRGIACDDLDNDGDVDVVILNSRERPTVLRNMLSESKSGNHWLQVCLRGRKTNRDGVGAQVRIVAGDLSQTIEVHSGRGYQSHFGTRLHFGLGERKQVDRIEIRWTGGDKEVLQDIAADQTLSIHESSGR